MDDYAGRVLADRYRLPLPPSDVFELVETRAFDTYSGQEVIVRQVPLPEVVEAEVVGPDGAPGVAGSAAGARATGGAGGPGRAGQGAADPAVRRALAAATAAARIPDHPRLDQVFHVFAESGSLWIVSELVSARPLAALLAERALSPHRAAEVAADVLTALRALHAHGWTHRNITTRTVLICDDGRAILTGLAAGAAEEALCGYDPVPEGMSLTPGTPVPGPGTGTAGSGASASGAPGSVPGARTAAGPGAGGAGRPPGAGFPGQRGAGAPPQGGAGRPPGGTVPPGTGAPQGAPVRGPGRTPPGGPGAPPPGPGTAPRGASGTPGYRDQGAAGGFPAAPGAPSGSRPPRAGTDGRDGTQDPRAARAGAIAAYRAGARAAARAAVEGAPATSTGASTWGGGSAASGTAPAPSPWTMPPPSRAHRSPNPQKVPAPQSRQSPQKPPRPGAPTGPGTAPAPQGGAAPASYTGHVSVDVPAPATPSGPNARTGQPGPPAPGGAAGPPGPSARWGGDGQPAGGLAAERARQARMAVVGAVTERWAPEQAWPVRESWQLAPPVGPAADLWALGALLFRVVQGHAPYPEESVAELVQVVCAEPPAYAEECGALRPVVESLMRKDPAERPEFEELRGWLRSLIRSAPEPEIGSRTVTVPSIGPSAPADQHRLPIVRRKGELVRRRRPRTTAPADPSGTASAHGRHKKSAKDQVQPRVRAHTTGHLQEQHIRTRRGSRSLGRLMLGLILLLLIGAVLYALLFMPGADESAGGESAERTGAAGVLSAAPSAPATSGRAGRPSPAGPAEAPAAGTAEVAKGFVLRQDPKGFTLAVAKDWQRRGENDRGQVVYAGGDIQLIVVPGRDKAAEFGTDPMAYQQDREPELEAYRTSSWSGASGLSRSDVGRTAAAEGAFNWNDSSGRQVYVRNSAMLLEGAYHVLQVIGPMNEQRTVDGYFDKALATYRFR
ncbi:protein kinase [Streptomyces sp. HU2014]|uniref:Protein kinase domain-containing protein n=1 Tax=Streptomyces albireticuli TaxID=1940 RepID=A0A1Z2L5I7_9ACTN|nr:MULTISPECIES: protein kinase [Streptomyces]ARZ69528.1 hypothetical protein SMD11_3913 [Streptomyces albireticuli]UQI43151.1 protein kinase [Streptomyces sp. HU2014]